MKDRLPWGVRMECLRQSASFIEVIAIMCNHGVFGVNLMPSPLSPRETVKPHKQRQYWVMVFLEMGRIVQVLPRFPEDIFQVQVHSFCEGTLGESCYSRPSLACSCCI